MPRITRKGAARSQCRPCGMKRFYGKREISAISRLYSKTFCEPVRIAAAYFMQRYRNVTICALVQFASGEKVVGAEPLVMFSSTAHSTASA